MGFNTACNCGVLGCHTRQLFGSGVRWNIIPTWRDTENIAISNVWFCSTSVFSLNIRFTRDLCQITLVRNTLDKSSINFFYHFFFSSHLFIFTRKLKQEQERLVSFNNQMSADLERLLNQREVWNFGAYVIW